MHKDLVNKKTDIEFSQIVENSSSIFEVAKKIGFSHSPGENSKKKIKDRIKNLGLVLGKMKNTEFSERIEINEHFYNCKDIGNVGVAKFILECVEFGLIVSSPFGDNSPYDFILDLNGELKKIQVKTTSVYDSGVSIFRTVKSYRINKKNISTKYKKSEIDYFYCYSIPLKEGYFIKSDDMIFDKEKETLSECVYIRKESKLNNPNIRESTNLIFSKVIENIFKK